MVGARGRYEGEIREFELWNPLRTNQKAGYYFIAVAEYIDSDWLSQCLKCHCLRCLKIDIQKQTWQCSECQSSGTFKKPEEKRESQGKKVTDRLLKGKKRH